MVHAGEYSEPGTPLGPMLTSGLPTRVNDEMRVSLVTFLVKLATTNGVVFLERTRRWNAGSM